MKQDWVTYITFMHRDITQVAWLRLDTITGTDRVMCCFRFTYLQICTHMISTTHRPDTGTLKFKLKNWVTYITFTHRDITQVAGGPGALIGQTDSDVSDRDIIVVTVIISKYPGS